MSRLGGSPLDFNRRHSALSETFDEPSDLYNMITKPLRRGSAPAPSGLSADTPPK